MLLNNKYYHDNNITYVLYLYYNVVILSWAS